MRSEDGDLRSSPSSGVLVGIPAYNEERSITAVVRDALVVADSVVVVDDGSDDDTTPLARDAGATVIEHEYNRGYGAALVTLFEVAARRSSDHLVVIDGDGQHDPTSVPKLVERQRRSGAGIVIGSRFVEGDTTNIPRSRRLGIHLVNWLVNLSLGRGRSALTITDTQSGFRSYDARTVRVLAATERIGDFMGASLDILYVASSNGLSVEEVGVKVSYDVPAPNSQDSLTHGASLVVNIIRNTFRTWG